MEHLPEPTVSAVALKAAAQPGWQVKDLQRHTGRRSSRRSRAMFWGRLDCRGFEGRLGHLVVCGFPYVFTYLQDADLQLEGLGYQEGETNSRGCEQDFKRLVCGL